ncbi:MAG: Transcriptional regulator, GntR family [Candidatus Carbobacillus altaicus]|uniref:Transcriptional regulator, GntR family n=1 Tax=Candidatus Carbonibacillus altaicus TaxID=2163959 RepID=A0A2R6Y044_9BACL|nr:MAG: Transcriptional regulator, GntR family [Candidatus Carbobacillus altaicus]
MNHLPFQLDPDDTTPLYEQIKRQLKELIMSDALPPGTLLPSIRALAEQLKVSVITTRRVYQDLELEGWLRSEQGRGTFVRDRDEDEIAEERMQLARGTLRVAVERCLRLGLTLEQIEALFAELLRE